MTKTVAVTGANGFIASALIRELLNKGYTVHTTVRSLKTLSLKSSHLLQLEPTGTRLKFFCADLLKEGSFKECFSGVDAVFHTASPFQIGVKDPQKDLVDPALKGTENVVSEALRVSSVTHIVLTSSVAAVRSSGKPSDYVFSASDFNDTSTLDKEPYPLSKVLAEKKAWELVGAQDRVKMVTINPAFVLGAPLSSRSDSTSISTIKSIFENATPAGPSFVLPLQFGCVPLDVVVAAHVAAYENPKASGRYILSTRSPFSHASIGSVLSKLFPNRSIPSSIPPNSSLNPPALLDASRALSDFNLSISPESVSVAIQQQIFAMLTLGIVSLD
mmetsp:Transcript_11869/g.17650  ORF Transcript_11869/g.17650 Transcript_11869/m.17650 type:complete len:331 (-) Transcript_11869:85-1077(-)